MKLTIKDLNIENKRVIIRVDFNVPIKDGKVVDDTRIRASLDTINYALEKKCKIILLSHLGRVKEEADKLKNTLEPVKNVLSDLLNRNVIFTRDFDNVKNIIDNMKYGDILLLENTRWFDYPEKLESNCDSNLSKYFSSLGDVFINDAFGTIHRKHASNFGISSNLESGIGFLVERELNSLSKLNNPKNPYVVILGGSKVSDKIGIIETLVKKVNYLLIGGGMAFTFLTAKGIKVGKSIVDEENIDFCKRILEDYGNKIILPVDVRVSNEFTDAYYKEVSVDNIDNDYMGLDIGNKTIDLFKNILKDAKTVLWNGPLGVYEFSNYQEGTKSILDFITKTDAYVVLGGGDIVSASNMLGYANKISHISTGGGATLEYIEGKNLPGLENIKEKDI